MSRVVPDTENPITSPGLAAANAPRNEHVAGQLVGRSSSVLTMIVGMGNLSGMTGGVTCNVATLVACADADAGWATMGCANTETAKSAITDPRATIKRVIMVECPYAISNVICANARIKFRRISVETRLNTDLLLFAIPSRWSDRPADWPGSPSRTPAASDRASPAPPRPARSGWH